MPDFKISVIIKQPSDIVWKAFIDPENMLHYTKYLEKVEVVQGKFGEIGAIAHLHYLEKGHSYILEDKLVDYEEGEKIGSQVSGQGMVIDVENQFESVSEGTKMTLSWNGTSKSFLTGIILKLMQKRIKEHAREELLTFKKLTEEYGFKFLAKKD